MQAPQPSSRPRPSGSPGSSHASGTADDVGVGSQNQSQKRRRTQSQLPLTLMQARLQRGWTQQEVADLIGTTAQSVSRWERGVAVPGPYHWGKLCALFGLSPAELGFSLETSTDNQGDTDTGDEARQAEGESSTSNSEGNSQTAAGEPESIPTHADLPLSASASATEAEGNRGGQMALSGHPPLPVHRRHSRLWRFVVISCAVALLAALLLLNWPSALPLLPSLVSPTAQPNLASSSPIGTIAFLSSDDFQGDSAQGMNDEVVIHLSGLPAPAVSTGYYAWITGTSGSEAVWIPLGQLTWTPTSGSMLSSRSGRGIASLFYVAPQHTNLLVSSSRFLITEEATNIPPQQPSSVWICEASISAVPTPGDPNHYSLLDHLRHLLAAEPSLAALGIRGGLIYWLTRNTEQVELEASDLPADWHAHRFSMLRQHLIRILDYLDGSSFVGSDVPAGTPLLVESPFARIGLLTLTSSQEPPGYILHTDIHLEGVRDALGASAFQRQLATRLRIAMNAVSFWLSNVRQDALQLVRMDDTRLAQSATLPLLMDLATQAQDAFTGSTNQALAKASVAPSAVSGAGVNWIESQSQQLATFNWYRV
jgi:transcriptional regulator with XRE-family HTH domain